MLALVFRGAASYTTGYAIERALDYLSIPHSHIDNNALWANPNIANQFDAAIVVDDGFGLAPRPLPLPANSVYYGIDLRADKEQHYLPYLTPYKTIFCAQYTHGVMQLEGAYSMRNVKWLPLAWDSLGIPYQDDGFIDPIRDIPVSFVCSRTTERRWYLAELAKHKYNGFTDNVFHEELGNVLSRSQIALNDFGGVGERVDSYDVNLRFFESMGCGALLLQRKMDFPDAEMLGFKDAEGWFRDADATHHFWNRKNPNGNEHYVSWESASQLFYTIDYFLQPEHEQERLEIANRGFEWAKNHTFVERAKVMLEELGIHVD